MGGAGSNAGFGNAFSESTYFGGGGSSGDETSGLGYGHEGYEYEAAARARQPSKTQTPVATRPADSSFLGSLFSGGLDVGASATPEAHTTLGVDTDIPAGTGTSGNFNRDIGGRVGDLGGEVRAFDTGQFQTSTNQPTGLQESIGQYASGKGPQGAYLAGRIREDKKQAGTWTNKDETAYRAAQATGVFTGVIAGGVTTALTAPIGLAGSQLIGKGVGRLVGGKVSGGLLSKQAGGHLSEISGLEAPQPQATVASRNVERGNGFNRSDTGTATGFAGGGSFSDKLSFQQPRKAQSQFVRPDQTKATVVSNQRPNAQPVQHTAGRIVKTFSRPSRQLGRRGAIQRG